MKSQKRKLNKMTKLSIGIIVYVLLTFKYFFYFFKSLLYNKSVPDGWNYLEEFFSNIIFFGISIIISFLLAERKLIYLTIGLPICLLLSLLTTGKVQNVAIIEIFLLLIYYILVFVILYQKYYKYN
jgi:hypothetical protein